MQLIKSLVVQQQVLPAGADRYCGAWSWRLSRLLFWWRGAAIGNSPKLTRAKFQKEHSRVGKNLAEE